MSDSEWSYEALQGALAQFKTFNAAPASRIVLSAQDWWELKDTLREEATPDRIFGLEIQVNRYMPPDVCAFADRDGKILSVIRLKPVAPSSGETTEP